jgi:phosphoglycerate kinase
VGALAAGDLRAPDAGAVFLLENLRFHKEEEANDPEFSRKLASLAPLYVNDAFGSAHRAHASTEGITHYTEKAAAGFLMDRELRYLGGALENPERPFVAIMGGVKISDKIEVIENLLHKVNHLLIGGAMTYTFLKSQGRRIGTSLCEEDKLELARDLMARTRLPGAAKILLPVDAVASRGIEDEAGAHTVAADAMPAEEMGLDIGPETVRNYASYIREAGTIVWNGPMGVFEKPAFANGTLEIAKAVAESRAVSIVGGGDSAAAVARAGVAGRITHVSTGGGASLEFLAGRVLPGVAALTDK